jgi:hypothetical protein
MIIDELASEPVKFNEIMYCGLDQDTAEVPITIKLSIDVGLILWNLLFPIDEFQLLN